MKLNLFLLSATAMVNAASGADTVAVGLGKAGDYAILAKTGISTVPSSVITGDIAVSPIAATAITGFSLIYDPSITDKSTSDQVTGKVYASTYTTPTPSILTTAVSNMETAYTNAANRPNEDTARTNIGGGEIGGSTLSPGVYTFTTDVAINDDVTFEGDASAVFIIQTTGNVIQADATKVLLSGGVLKENIFWQVAGKVIVEPKAHMEGVLLVKTSATFNTKSTLNGRILAQTAVVLQQATINSAPLNDP
jgi:hypothetical protein